MNKVTLERYRTLLQRLAVRINGDARAVTDEVLDQGAGQGAGELSNAPMHLGDMGTEEYLRDLNATLLEHEQFLGDEVRDALARIDARTFGSCLNCGKPIAKERLDALPYVRYCKPCAETIDVKSPANLDAGRPHNPSDTLAPEGEMDEDRHQSRRSQTDPEPQTIGTRPGDIHAAGTPGGGTFLGGLAGSTSGRGEPDIADLQDAMGSGSFETEEAASEIKHPTPKSGRSGGAVGGTPVGKRAGGESPSGRNR